MAIETIMVDDDYITSYVHSNYIFRMAPIYTSGYDYMDIRDLIRDKNISDNAYIYVYYKHNKWNRINNIGDYDDCDMDGKKINDYMINILFKYDWICHNIIEFFSDRTNLADEYNDVLEKSISITKRIIDTRNKFHEILNKHTEDF